jgi:hypothetical protein
MEMLAALFTPLFIPGLDVIYSDRGSKLKRVESRKVTNFAGSTIQFSTLLPYPRLSHVHCGLI